MVARAALDHEDGVQLPVRLLGDENETTEETALEASVMGDAIFLPLASTLSWEWEEIVTKTRWGVPDIVLAYLGVDVGSIVKSRRTEVGGITETK